MPDISKGRAPRGPGRRRIGPKVDFRVPEEIDAYVRAEAARRAHAAGLPPERGNEDAVYRELVTAGARALGFAFNFEETH